MTVTLILRNQEFETKAGMTLRETLLKVGILPESVIALREGQIITDDEILRDGETIKLVAAISGGTHPALNAILLLKGIQKR